VAALVVIAGPIGAGKSTVAGRVARRCAEAGVTAAVVDLDDVAFAQRGMTDITEGWRRGGVAAAALVRGWFDAGTNVVVAHGPFFESGGYEALQQRALPAGVAIHHVLLRVAFDEAVRRVQSDPERRPGAPSRDPDFLRRTHDTFANDVESSLPSPHLVVETDRVAPDLAAARVAALLFDPEVSEADIEDLLRRGRPHPLVADVPPTLRPWLLPMHWDQERLWQAGRPVTDVLVSELRWLYDLPWWRGEHGDDRWFRVTPRAVLDDRGGFAEHARRIEQANLARPLHAIRRRGRLVVLDGLHRLVKADLDHRASVEVVLLDAGDLGSILVHPS